MIQNDKSYRIKIGSYLKTGPYETESERGGEVYMPIAVVSGADRNIGLEIVKQFLQRG